MLNPLAQDLDHVLTHTEGIWDELRGQKLFLTGGTGFFGCWLLESFIWANEKLALGASVTVLTRDPDAFRRKAPHLACHPMVELYAGDVKSFDFPASTFSHIIHAATESSTGLNESNPLAMLDTIINGTRRVLDFAVARGARKLLLTSSGAVYGRQPPELTHVPESYSGAPDPVDVRSAYGEGKRVAELLCAIYYRDHGIESKIARCFAFVGPYLPLDAHFAIGNFIRDRIEGRPIQVNGDGSPYRSYLYAADLAIWLWTILICGKACRPYNVGSRREYAISQIATMAARTQGPVLPVEICEKLHSGVRPERYVPEVIRSAAELGLECHLELPQAILRTADWVKHQPTTARTGEPVTFGA